MEGLGILLVVVATFVANLPATVQKTARKSALAPSI